MIKKVVSYILTLILIILLTSSIALVIFSTTVLNENFIINMLNKEEYYSKTYSQIMERFRDNTIQSGLEDDVLDEIISEEQIKKDVKSLVRYIYSGTKLSIDTENVKTKLKENIDKTIEENNKKLTKNEQEAVNIYVSTIANIYDEQIALSDKYIPDVQNVVMKLKEMVDKIKVIIYIATLAVAIIVVIINREKSFKYLFITGIATGILLIIPKIIETAAIQTNNIVVFNQTLSSALINIVELVMFRFLVVRNIFVHSSYTIKYFC